MAQTQKTKKEFGISSMSVDNRSTIFVLTFILLVAGLISYISLPKEAFPEIVFPEIYVGTSYPGYSPSDMEKLITRPIEKEINTIVGLDEMTSTSVQGYSMIRGKFQTDIEIDEAVRKVKDAVDKARGDKDFPQDLPADPNVFEINASEFPIMNINLSGDFSLDELKKYGEYLEDEIEKITEISKVEIRGIQDKEVKVLIDNFQMEARQVSFDDIQNAISASNISMSGGDVLNDGLRRTVRVDGEFSDPSEIENVIVKQENFDVVYLKDIADVVFAEEEKQSYAREFRNPVVMLDVVKRSGENLLVASDKIAAIIKKAQEGRFPDNLQISVTNDQSNQTRAQVANLENSIISGIILVVLVLLFFLGSRNALFVGAAIPLSMFTAFIILGYLGITLNIMVLFSLILALGMLVDNGIVVVENIYRLMDEGLDSRAAAKQGVGEVAWPIITSTATTLAAFLPLAMWPGLMGEFMKYLPITLMIVLGSSLFVALVINPVLTSKWMKVADPKPNKKKLRNISLILVGMAILGYLAGASNPEMRGSINTFSSLLVVAAIIIFLNVFVFTPWTKVFQEKMVPVMEDYYDRTLRFALRGKNDKRFLFGTFGLFILSFVLLGAFTPRVEFFPINEPKYVNVFIEKPIGTDIEVTDKLTNEIEDMLLSEMSKYDEQDVVNGDTIRTNFMVESIIGQVGEGTADPNAGAQVGNTPHKARITVNFVEYKFRRGINTIDIMEDIRSLLKGIPGVQIAVDKDPAGPPQTKPINIEVSGEDYDILMDEAEKLRTYISNSNVQGIEELQLDVHTGKPELLVQIDKEKAKRFSVSTYQIANTIRTALFGAEVSTYKDGEDDYPINIRLKDDIRYNSEALLNQKITFRDPSNGKISQVPISAVATSIKSSTYSSVKRKDLFRVITISSNVLANSNANEVVANIKKELENYKMSAGINFTFTGQQEEQAKEMAFLSKALLIAVFLIFLIIVSQFNSMSTPFIIVGSVVLSMIGVLLGLVAFQMDFIVIMTMVGIISLAGVVVNNAIVLIDYTNLLIGRKKEELGLSQNERLSIEQIKESIIEGGAKRLRPVLLTAITTVLGLLPLAVGMNIDFYSLLSDFDPNLYFGGDNTIFWGPMSWTIIFGLTFATFLTLIIVPVMYYIRFKLKYRLQKA